MPHYPEPFYRAPRRLWYVQVDGKQINLGREDHPRLDSRGQPVARAEVMEKYHRLMADRGQEAPTPPVDSSLAVVVVDQFLDWVQRRKAPRTFEWYQRHCEAFARSIPRTLPIGQLRPFHLTKVCDAHADWSPTTKHGFCRAIQRAFRWATRQGVIDRSPLGDVEKPEPPDRDVVLSPEEYREVLGLTRGAFRTLLMMAWESGIRPQEVRAVEAKHLDTHHGRIVFPPKESKGKKLPRIVYLTDEALAIARPLAEAHPTGPIFRNADGAPWTRYAINCAFIRFQIAFGRAVMEERGIAVPKLPRFRKAKVDAPRLPRARDEQELKLKERRKEITRLALQHGRKLHLGAFRKSFATEALKNGVDPVTASHLLGHSNTNMLAKVYARLAQDPEYLRAQAKKATGGGR